MTTRQSTHPSKIRIDAYFNQILTTCNDHKCQSLTISLALYRSILNEIGLDLTSSPIGHKTA